MNVFVVLVDAMGGVQLVGVFAKQDQAQERLNAITFGGNPRVHETPVLGAQPDPGIVYSAEYYERGFDVHFFEAVYGSREAARSAVGDVGLVIPRTL